MRLLACHISGPPAPFRTRPVLGVALGAVEGATVVGARDGARDGAVVTGATVGGFVGANEGYAWQYTEQSVVAVCSGLSGTSMWTNWSTRSWF